MSTEEKQVISTDGDSGEQYVDPTDMSLEAYGGEGDEAVVHDADGTDAPWAEPTADEPDESQEAQQEEAQAEEGDTETPTARSFAALVREQKEIRRQQNELAEERKRLAGYMHTLQSAVSDPDQAAALLSTLGIDVDSAVDRIARHRLGITEQAPKDDSAKLFHDLRNEIVQLKQQLSVAPVARSTERHVSRALSAMKEDLPFLSDAVSEDPDLVDEIVDSITEQRRRGVNVDIAEILRTAEGNIEERVRRNTSWALKNPKLRSMLGIDPAQGASPRVTVAKETAHERIMKAAKEPAGGEGFLTEEELDRLMAEDIARGSI